MNMRNDKNRIEVWLTKEEKNDPAIQERLRQLYAQCKSNNCAVIVYQSGERDLYQSVRDLLLYNRTRTGPLAMKREKASSANA